MRNYYCNPTKHQKLLYIGDIIKTEPGPELRLGSRLALNLDHIIFKLNPFILVDITKKYHQFATLSVNGVKNREADLEVYKLVSLQNGLRYCFYILPADGDYGGLPILFDRIQ